MFGVSIVEGRLSVEDAVGDCGYGWPGDIADLFDALLHMGEGPIELILFAEGILANQFEVTGITLNSPVWLWDVFWWRFGFTGLSFFEGGEGEDCSQSEYEYE